MGRAAERNQPRHVNRDIPSETHVLLVYVPSVRILGACFPPRRWPVPFTRPRKCLLRVATCIPVLLEISLWLSWPCSNNSRAFTMSHSVHCCNFLPRWANLGFHLILCTSLRFFTFCLPCFCLAMMMLKLKKINLFKCLAWCLGWLVGGWRVYRLNKLLSASIVSTQEWECKVCLFFWHRNNTCPMVPSVTTAAINPFNSIRICEDFHPPYSREILFKQGYCIFGRFFTYATVPFQVPFCVIFIHF